MPRVERWWPHTLGRPALHDVRVEVRLDTGEPSDQRTWRTGFRTIELRNWIATVNGERLYLKGVTLSPQRADLALATRGEFATTLRAVRDAGLDFVRVHAHISRPELYEIADELGLHVWQDLPVLHRFSRGVRAQAVRQAREAVDVLGHHPSVFLWCAHDEPYVVRGPRDAAITPRADETTLLAATLVAQTAFELFSDPQLVAAAWREFRMTDEAPTTE